MDEKKEPKVTLKLPFAGRTVRVRPLNGDQMVAMSLLDTSNPMRILKILMRLLENQTTAAEWDDILADHVCGRATAKDVLNLLVALSEGSSKALKAAEAPAKTLDVPAADPYDAMSHGLSVDADA